MMGDFDLAETCNSLIRSLEKELGSKSILRLSLDVQLPNRIIGDQEGLRSSIVQICEFLTSHLINGLVDIEIVKTGQHNGSITLTVEVRGSDSSNEEKRAMKALSEMNMNWLSTMPYKTSFSIHHEFYHFSFRMTFDRVKKEEKEPRPRFADAKILIAEDNETNAMVFTSFLEDWGCEVTVVANGEEAISKINQQVFDLVLMDIYMPKMNGTASTRLIRQVNKTIPIIILTASSLELDINECFSAGANDFLLKPISSSQLRSVIEKYL
ncbi:MAG: response regulator [Bacteroidetes bacterium]|nr:response regulator [Bacteroidota bacterium]